jgi:hypothetical protein
VCHHSRLASAYTPGIVPVGPIVAPSNPRTIDVGVEQICTYARLEVPFSSATARLRIRYALENPGLVAVPRVHETIHRETIASMEERTNSELDVAAMVMLLDCGMSLKDIAECFRLEVKAVERRIVEYQRSRASKQRT